MCKILNKLRNNYTLEFMASTAASANPIVSWDVMTYSSEGIHHVSVERTASNFRAELYDTEVTTNKQALFAASSLPIV